MQNDAMIIKYPEKGTQVDCVWLMSSTCTRAQPTANYLFTDLPMYKHCYLLQKVLRDGGSRRYRLERNENLATSPLAREGGET